MSSGSNNSFPIDAGFGPTAAWSSTSSASPVPLPLHNLAASTDFTEQIQSGTNTPGSHLLAQQVTSTESQATSLLIMTNEGSTRIDILRLLSLPNSSWTKSSLYKSINESRDRIGEPDIPINVFNVTYRALKRRSYIIDNNGRISITAAGKQALTGFEAYRQALSNSEQNTTTLSSNAGVTPDTTATGYPGTLLQQDILLLLQNQSLSLAQITDQLQTLNQQYAVYLHVSQQSAINEQTVQNALANLRPFIKTKNNIYHLNHAGRQAIARISAFNNVIQSTEAIQLIRTVEHSPKGTDLDTLRILMDPNRPLSSRDISDILSGLYVKFGLAEVNPSSLHKVLERLVEQGYLKKNTSEKPYTYVITAQGQRILQSFDQYWKFLSNNILVANTLRPIPNVNNRSITILRGQRVITVTSILLLLEQKHQQRGNQFTGLANSEIVKHLNRLNQRYPAHLELDVPNVRRHTDNLVKEGLLEKTEVQGSFKDYYYRLTPTGRQFVASIVLYQQEVRETSKPIVTATTPQQPSSVQSSSRASKVHRLPNTEAGFVVIPLPLRSPPPPSPSKHSEQPIIDTQFEQSLAALAFAERHAGNLSLLMASPRTRQAAGFDLVHHADGQYQVIAVNQAHPAYLGGETLADAQILRAERIAELQALLDSGYLDLTPNPELTKAAGGLVVDVKLLNQHGQPTSLSDLPLGLLTVYQQPGRLLSNLPDLSPRIYSNAIKVIGIVDVLDNVDDAATAVAYFSQLLHADSDVAFSTAVNNLAGHLTALSVGGVSGKYVISRVLQWALAELGSPPGFTIVLGILAALPISSWGYAQTRGRYDKHIGALTTPVLQTLYQDWLVRSDDSDFGSLRPISLFSDATLLEFTQQLAQSLHVQTPVADMQFTSAQLRALFDPNNARALLALGRAANIDGLLPELMGQWAAHIGLEPSSSNGIPRAAFFADHYSILQSVQQALVAHQQPLTAARYTQALAAFADRFQPPGSDYATQAQSNYQQMMRSLLTQQQQQLKAAAQGYNNIIERLTHALATQDHWLQQQRLTSLLVVLDHWQASGQRLDIYQEIVDQLSFEDLSLLQLDRSDLLALPEHYLDFHTLTEQVSRTYPAYRDSLGTQRVEPMPTVSLIPLPAIPTRTAPPSDSSPPATAVQPVTQISPSDPLAAEAIEILDMVASQRNPGLLGHYILDRNHRPLVQYLLNNPTLIHTRVQAHTPGVSHQAAQVERLVLQLIDQLVLSLVELERRGVSVTNASQLSQNLRQLTTVAVEPSAQLAQLARYGGSWYAAQLSRSLRTHWPELYQAFQNQHYIETVRSADNQTQALIDGIEQSKFYPNALIQLQHADVPRAEAVAIEQLQALGGRGIVALLGALSQTGHLSRSYALASLMNQLMMHQWPALETMLEQYRQILYYSLHGAVANEQSIAPVFAYAALIESGMRRTLARTPELLNQVYATARSQVYQDNNELERVRQHLLSENEWSTIEAQAWGLLRVLLADADAAQAQGLDPATYLLRHKSMFSRQHLQLIKQRVQQNDLVFLSQLSPPMLLALDQLLGIAPGATQTGQTVTAANAQIRNSIDPANRPQPDSLQHETMERTAYMALLLGEDTTAGAALLELFNRQQREVHLGELDFRVPTDENGVIRGLLRRDNLSPAETHQSNKLYRVASKVKYLATVSSRYQANSEIGEPENVSMQMLLWRSLRTEVIHSVELAAIADVLEARHWHGLSADRQEQRLGVAFLNSLASMRLLDDFVSAWRQHAQTILDERLHQVALAQYDRVEQRLQAMLETEDGLSDDAIDQLRSVINSG